MPLPIEVARRELQRFQSSSRIQNLFAQAHAKRVLLEVGELQENFPAFTEDLDDRVTWAAYEILAAACTLAEQGERAEAVSPLEQGATLLEHLHRVRATPGSEAAFHLLLAAMAFYAAGQYSRAFVAMRSAEGVTTCAKIIGGFLRRDVPSAIESATDAIITITSEHAGPIDPAEDAGVDAGVTVAVARAVHLALEYAHTGDRSLLEAAEDHAADAITIASWGRAPSWWFVARLLRLMLRDLGESSLWAVLPEHFPPTAQADLDRYARLHALSKKPAWDLWRSQRDALALALSTLNRGAVLNLRTSGGKTRLAELAILQTLLADRDAKVLFLAPFRSLALEVEHTLNATLGALGFTVSHLYGGSRVSSVDARMASEASIIIATPEKARAILRASPELIQPVKLVVIDEGHLLGFEERLVRNELFLDHVRAVATTLGARVLLLSAVLPNAPELATWIGGDAATLAKSSWKPSAERLGALLWNGQRVRLDWHGTTLCFNPRFVVRDVIPGTKKQFPKDKNEAIAATAVRLAANGPVMIFSGQARSIPPLARAVLTAFEISGAGAHEWADHEWRVFEAVCREDLPADAIELEAARAGILCHHAKLPTQVRLAMEHLMRASPPRIIIATTTLAQGVNVGVTSVIVASVLQGRGRSITARDFWNICGRAGRAFVDGEGRVLYAIDETKSVGDVRKARTEMQSYFDGRERDTARSGVLALAQVIQRIAQRSNVDFERLLELMAENDFGPTGDDAADLASALDAVDDELLSLHGDALVNPEGADSLAWIERVFRSSLAAIQAERGLTADDLVRFMTARTMGVLKMVGSADIRRPIVTSGLPVRAALTVRSGLDAFRVIGDALAAAPGDPSVLADAARSCEEWVRAAALSVASDVPAATVLERLRAGWLAGTGVQTLCGADRADLAVITRFYNNDLPWVLHAVAQQLRCDDDTDRADAIDRLALLIELGLPNETAALIYLAGLRSRVAATELAAFGDAHPFGASVGAVAARLRSESFVRTLKAIVTAETAEWLELVRRNLVGDRDKRISMFRFSVPAPPSATVLHARRARDIVYLMTPDLRWSYAVASTADMPFGRVANDVRYWFLKDGEGAWRLEARDPRLVDEEGWTSIDEI